jgi:SusD family.
MKRLKNILIALSVVSLAGCDYLDIVPDEQTTEFNTYDTPAKAKNYLNACYGYLPNARASEALDKMTGGEIAVANEEKNEWSKFSRGYYSPAAPSLAKTYWESCYNGIRTCWQFLSVVDKTPNITEEDLTYYKAEAHLLIAYYHWLILRAFGPAVIIDKAYDATTPYSEYPERSPYDKCVEFIDGEIEIALKGLKDEQFFETNDYGRLTRYCALALRSRMYLYAASPLFNGNSEFYSDFKNSAGEHLISQEYKAEKWEKAAEVTLAAINEMENVGFRLYDTTDAGAAAATKPGMNDLHERAVRWAFIDNDGNNPEVIWGDTRQESAYMVSNQSTPYQQTHKNGNKNSWSLIAPTLETVKRFYTKNGLPIDQDKEWDYANWDKTSLITKENYSHDADYLNGCPSAGLKEYAAGKPLLNDTILNLHLGREPRFYAWIGFHNGPFEISQFYGVAIIGNQKNRIVKLDLKYGQDQGWDGRSTNYSISGYLNKKCVSPLYKVGPAADQYPFPVFRMAEMYLNYAEALIETKDPANFQTAKDYIDKVRERAGVPKIDKAWAKSKAGAAYANTYEGLQAIVRQERQIEFYMENHRFWDLRRWKDAESLGEIPEGMNISGKTDKDFLGTIKKLNVIRNFSQKNYLMPIPVGETDKVPQIIQNPGY